MLSDCCDVQSHVLKQVDGDTIAKLNFCFTFFLLKVITTVSSSWEKWSLDSFCIKFIIKLFAVYLLRVRNGRQFPPCGANNRTNSCHLCFILDCRRIRSIRSAVLWKEWVYLKGQTKVSKLLNYLKNLFKITTITEKLNLV